MVVAVVFTVYVSSHSYSRIFCIYAFTVYWSVDGVVLTSSTLFIYMLLVTTCLHL